MPTPIYGNTGLAVYDITQITTVTPAVGDGLLTSSGINTAAIMNVITTIQGLGVGGIIYIPPSPSGFVVNNGHIFITSPNIILMGAGGMGNQKISESPTGIGSSTIIGNGSGDTITIWTPPTAPAGTPQPTGCAVRNLSFMQYGGGGNTPQTGSECFLHSRYGSNHGKQHSHAIAQCRNCFIFDAAAVRNNTRWILRRAILD